MSEEDQESLVASDAMFMEIMLKTLEFCKSIKDEKYRLRIIDLLVRMLTSLGLDFNENETYMKLIKSLQDQNPSWKPKLTK
jgi:hypothetical protein